MNWTAIAAGLVRAVNLIVGWARDAGLRRQGSEKAELQSLRARETIRRKANEIDGRALPDRDDDVLERL